MFNQQSKEVMPLVCQRNYYVETGVRHPRPTLEEDTAKRPACG